MSSISENPITSSARSRLALLDVIHRKPGMFWGPSDYPFTSLVAFLSGHQCGFAAAQHGAELVPDGLITEGFAKFVTERFGRTYPDGGRGWQMIIREHTANEREAFELFFSLQHEFERLTGNTPVVIDSLLT